MARSFQEGMKHRCANTVQPLKNMSNDRMFNVRMFNDLLMTRPLQEGKSKFAYILTFRRSFLS